MSFVSMDVMTSMSTKLAHNTKSGRWMKIINTGRSMKHKDSGFVQTAMLLQREQKVVIESLVLNVKKVTASLANFLQTLRMKSMSISMKSMEDILIEILKMFNNWAVIYAKNLEKLLFFAEFTCKLFIQFFVRISLV